MKALMVTTDSITIRSFLLPHVQHMQSRGWQVDGAALSIEDDPATLAVVDNAFPIPFSRSPKDILSLLKAYRQIQTIVASNDYQLVHVHTPIAAFIVRLALRKFRRRGLKVLYTAHGFHFHPLGGKLSNAVYLMMEKLAGRWGDGLVVINKTDFEVAKKHRLAPPSRFFFSPGIGVDTREPRVGHPPSFVDGEFSYLQHARAVFLQVAEFNPGKRHRDTIDALVQLADANIHVLFAGKGPLADEIKAYASQQGVAAQVHFLGYRRDIPGLCTMSTAMILPSVREGLPRSVMEAMVLGVPVIGYAIRGMVDLIDDSRGRLVEPGNVAALSEAMRVISDKPSLREAMAVSCRRHIQKYSQEKVLAVYDDIYRTVCEIPQ